MFYVQMTYIFTVFGRSDTETHVFSSCCAWTFMLAFVFDFGGWFPMDHNRWFSLFAWFRLHSDCRLFFFKYIFLIVQQIQCTYLSVSVLKKMMLWYIDPEKFVLYVFFGTIYMSGNVVLSKKDIRCSKQTI